MALVSFEQDQHPDAPPGAGYFLADSGERAYAYDPNLAQSLAGQPPPVMPMAEPEKPSYDLMSVADDGGDQRLAYAGQDVTSHDPAMDAGGQQQQVAPSVADVGPNMSAAPPPAANMSQAGPMSVAPPPAAPAPQGPPPEVDEDERIRQAIRDRVSRKVYHAPVKGGLRVKSAEVTSEGAEPEMAPEDWKELQSLNQNIEKTEMTKAMLARAQAEHQIAQVQAKMPALQMQYEEDKRKYDSARSLAKRDLGNVQMMLRDVSEKKVDHGRFFRERGVLGQLAAGIAQAFGASAAILSGTGHNMVADQMNRMIDEDIAQQKDEIENGRANANNALQLLRDRYNFDIPQAESALKIAQLGVVNAQIQQYEGMKMSAEATAGFDAWIAKNRKEQFLEARKIYTASMGKVTKRQQMVMQPGSRGGWRDPNHKETMDSISEIEGLQKIGAVPKPGDGAEKIPDELVIYKSDGTPVKARSKEEAVDVRKKAVMYKKIMPGIDKMEKSAGHLNTLSPDERATFDVNWETTVSTLNSSLGQGVMHDDDIKRWRGYLDQGNFGAKRALAEMRAIAQNGYDSEVDAQAGPQLKEDFSKGKPKASYTKKRAVTPTVGRSQAGADASLDDLTNARESYK